MKKSSLLILTLLALAGLQSCKSDPNGPGSAEPLMLATIRDSAVVDASGMWRLNSAKGTHLILSPRGAEFYSQGVLQFQGAVKHDRHLITKFGGRERICPIYRIRLDGREEYIQMGVYTDSLFIAECDPDPDETPLSILGVYVR